MILTTKESIMHHKLLGVVALVFSLALSTSVFAHHSGCGGEGMKKMLESLNLDATQKEKIKPFTVD